MLVSVNRPHTNALQKSALRQLISRGVRILHTEAQELTDSFCLLSHTQVSPNT